MELLRRRDPETHAHLDRLRNEDPEAFREALRQYLAALRRAHGLSESDGHEGRRRGSRRPAHPDGRASRRPPLDPADARIAELEGELTALARQYREAAGDRAAVHEAMRARIETWIALKHDQAARRIRRLESHLDQLRDALAESRNRRDEAVEQQMRRWLTDE